ncbi:ABC transporter permease [Mycobacterium vicinigordonae]|uniref:ABC transporter permease n=1 Tax=Mycobacterium vicinigordonae TaxID=1719132 RepID=UPI003CCE08C9
MDTPTTPTPSASEDSSAGALVRRWWPPVLAIAAAVALWWLATAVLAPPQSLLRETTPDRVIRSLVDLFKRGVLLADTGVSLWRLLIGLLVGGVIGIPVGLLIGLNDTADRASRPVVQFLRMISPLSWAPISVALFGIGNEPVIFLIAAASVWPILINTAAGVHAIDPGYFQVARSLGATRAEQLQVVVLPAIRGHLQTGLRVALGIAWVVLVPAEMLGVRSGLGYQILNARDQLAYGQVVAVIVVIGSIGYVLDLAARRLLSGSRTDRQS